MEAQKVVYFYVMKSSSSRIPDSHRLHLAKDGHTAIVRFLGGRVSAAQWEELAGLSASFGDASLRLTSRGGVQVRGIADPRGFATAVTESDVLPTKHGHPQVLASASVSNDLLLEIGSCVENISEDRLLIGLDDGKGDVLVNRPDFGFATVGDDTHVIVGGDITPHTTTNPGETLENLLVEWLKRSGASRRVDSEFRSWALSYLESSKHTQRGERPSIILPSSPQVGWIQNDEKVTLGLGVPMATMSAKIAHILGAVGAHTTITGWPSLLIHDLDEGDAEAVAKVLAPQGMVFDAESPWLKVTSCVGTQGCSRALSDVRTDAQHYLASSGGLTGRTHFSGCGHKCGRPAETTIDYIATGDGEYEVEEIA